MLSHTVPFDTVTAWRYLSFVANLQDVADTSNWLPTTCCKTHTWVAKRPSRESSVTQIVSSRTTCALELNSAKSPERAAFYRNVIWLVLVNHRTALRFGNGRSKIFVSIKRFSISIDPFINQTFNQSIDWSIGQSINQQSINYSINQSIVSISFMVAILFTVNLYSFMYAINGTVPWWEVNWDCTCLKVLQVS